MAGGGPHPAAGAPLSSEKVAPSDRGRVAGDNRQVALRAPLFPYTPKVALHNLRAVNARKQFRENLMAALVLRALCGVVVVFAAQRFVDTGDGACLALALGCPWIGRFGD